MDPRTYGRWWLRSKRLRKQVLQEAWQRHKPCAGQQVALVNPSSNKHVKQATLRPMVFRPLATDAPVTNIKHCGSYAMRLIGCWVDFLLPFVGRL